MRKEKREKDNFLYRGKGKIKGGFNELVTPKNSSLRLLSYSRLILNKQIDNFLLNCSKEEFFFFLMKGSVTAMTNNEEIELESLDGFYVSRGEDIFFHSARDADIYVFSSPAKSRYPFCLVRYTAVQNNPKLHYFIGSKENNDYREQHVYLYSGIPAARLLFGFARGEPGNWCSVPPHKHTERMEEIYIFFDMEDSPCGIQFIYDDDKDLSHSHFVQNEDAVVVPYGYHPNVAFPGKKMNFIWAMASHKENDRKLVINIQPELCLNGRQTIEPF